MVMPTPAPARDLSIPRSLTVSTQAPPSADALVEILERSIATGELPPGSKLPSERELSVQCGVSRPVVREALRSLQERGDIEIRPSRGAYVRAVRPGDVAGRFESFARQRGATVRDLVQVRRSLESTAARLAATHATPEQRDQLLAIVEAMDSTTDPFEHARFDIAFHTLLAQASGNPVVEIMFGSIAPLAFEQMLRSMTDPGVGAAGNPLHRVVAEAVVRGDGEGAASAMNTHISLAEQMFGHDVDRPLADIAESAIRTLGESSSLEEVIESALASLVR